MDVTEFKQLPYMGILRGIESKSVDRLVETIISSGLRTIEITMNTPGAGDLIRETVSVAGGELIVGAGTVLTIDDLHEALDGGATFIVLPTLVPEVVDYCAKNNVPVFPGALTPQEIHDAWNAGAAMVKVFPASFFGPEYFREIKGPFTEIELLACGGVNSGNVQSFFTCGASAVAFGGSVFKKEWIEANEFKRIEECIIRLLKGFHQ